MPSIKASTVFLMRASVSASFPSADAGRVAELAPSAMEFAHVLCDQIGRPYVLFDAFENTMLYGGKPDGAAIIAKSCFDQP